MPGLFNKKILDERLKKYEIDNLDEKINKIEEWQKNLGRIKGLNEKRLQGAFLRAIFEDILGYENTPQKDNWTLDIEATTDVDAKHPDGIIGFFERTDNEEIRGHEAVIELKGPQISLDKDQKRQGTTYKSPVDQAFSYTNKLDKCKWVIVSNFMEIRLYKVGRSKEYFEVFLLDELDQIENFKKFYYLLNQNNLLSETGNSITLELSEKTIKKEEDISVKFYNLYKNVRINLFEHLKENNSDKDPELLLEKAQKFLDRIIFIGFCEDKGLLPNDLLHEAIQRGKDSFSPSDTAVWDQIRGVFRSIDKGNDAHNINAYNGGLFEYDEDLDGLIIKNNFFEAIYKISDYDFDSDVDVNILGHIFEQSISDLEKLKSDIKDNEFDKNKSKRKKDGIFYTPQNITSYIVENAIGGYLEELKEKLGYYDLPNIEKAGSKSWTTIYTNDHLDFYNEYEEKLKNIKVLDPACGSGAFLNQAFDYLLKEHQWLNKQRDLLKGGQSSIFALDAIQRNILKNNIFGVDLNEESVEITKLSLWLKTANKNKPLTNLDDNIKCGNSLVDETRVVGNKAFNWNDKFKNIMDDGGFDVVIGNPPYVGMRKLDKDYIKYLKSNYVSLDNRINLFQAFIEKSINVLKENGKFGMIIHRNIIRSNEYMGIRKFILEKTFINNILSFKNGVFEEVVGEMVVFILNKRNTVKSKSNEIKIYNFDKKINLTEPSKIIPQKVFESSMGSRFNVYLNREIIKVISKINKIDLKLKDISFTRQGIIVGNEKKYVVKQKKSLKYKPILRGRDIDRYNYPLVNEYLFYEPNILTRARTKDIFEIESKILTKHVSEGIYATLDKENKYFLQTINGTIINNDKFSDEYILGILNSKLMSFYYDYSFNLGAEFTTAVAIKNLDLLPIPNKMIEIQKPIIENVNKMLNKKKEVADVSSYNFKDVNIKYTSSEGLTLDNILKDNSFINKIYSGRASKIRNFTVNINTNIITIYLDKSGSDKYEVLKFEEDDKFRRQYIKYYLENLTDEQLEEIDDKYSGNILKKTLQIEIPDYNKDHVVKKVVKEWESLHQEIENLENEIERIDNEIDQIVYKLYNLTEEEIQIVEESIDN